MTNGNSMISLASSATVSPPKDHAPTRTSGSFGAHLHAPQSFAAAPTSPEEAGGAEPSGGIAAEADAGTASGKAGNVPVKTGKPLPHRLPHLAALETQPGKADPILLPVSGPIRDGDGEPAEKADKAAAAQDAAAAAVQTTSAIWETLPGSTVQPSGLVQDRTGNGNPASECNERALPDAKRKLAQFANAAGPSQVATTTSPAGPVKLATGTAGARAAGNQQPASGAAAATTPAHSDGGLDSSGPVGQVEPQQGSASPGHQHRASTANVSVTLAPAPKLRSDALSSQAKELVRKLGNGFAEAAEKAPSSPATPTAVSGPIPGGARPDGLATAATGPNYATAPQALQEITHIVDRLAAAREALAPSAVSLAIKHADFGDLSLRFDQHRDGHLAVQIAASNPEAHRAVSAAMSQQPFSAAHEQQAGTGGQNFSQSQTAARDANAGGARNGSSGSEGSASQGHPHQRRAPGGQGGAQQSGPRRSGIFA